MNVTVDEILQQIGGGAFSQASTAVLLAPLVNVKESSGMFPASSFPSGIFFASNYFCGML